MQASKHMHTCIHDMYTHMCMHVCWGAAVPYQHALLAVALAGGVRDAPCAGGAQRGRSCASHWNHRSPHSSAALCPGPSTARWSPAAAVTAADDDDDDDDNDNVVCMHRRLCASIGMHAICMPPLHPHTYKHTTTTTLPQQAQWMLCCPTVTTASMMTALLQQYRTSSPSRCDRGLMTGGNNRG
jgi:hypothetical protein